LWGYEVNKRISWTVVAAMVIAAPVMAQDSAQSLALELLQAARLPTVAREARGLGVPERDLQDIFATGRARGISAGSMASLFSEENDAIRANGRIDNFGAFVQERLNSGLRGRDLAAAIHAEHAARGMGRKATVTVVDVHGKPIDDEPSDKPHVSDKPDKLPNPDKSGKSGKPDKQGGTR
jgi:hypothetical protein